MTLTLSDPSLLETRGLLGGEWVEGSKTFAVVNPATGETIADVADLTAEDTRKAIDIAYEAQKEWRRKTAKERCAILLKWNDLMLENQEDLGKILTAEMGKPLAEAKGEIAYGASFIQWFAEEARRVYGDVIPGHQADKRIVVIKQPVGVVASITPWNFPNAMIARKVAPALASGCTFVARPAKETPLSAIAMAVLAERAGVPKGVLSMIPGSDSKGIGAEMCSNPKVRKLTFTGSTEVGRILMKQCAHDIKKLSLELGGNAPFLVFDDADLDAAVEGAMIAKFRNSGQTCVCANRIYVQDGVYDEFVKKFAEKVKAVKVGNGFEDGVSQGPLIEDAAVEKVQRHVADAVAKGGKIVVGGKKLQGQFFEPTVLSEAQQNMLCATEETFGPFAPVFRFKTEQEVIAMANATIFGLATYFYTRDVGRIFRVSEALEYGMVGINVGVLATEHVPFGGVKQSGLGREGSHHGMDDYVELKYLCLGDILK